MTSSGPEKKIQRAIFVVFSFEKN